MTHLHLSDSSLSPTEKEEREVERLIDKKPAPSRKNTERRGPKHDSRRDRMKTDDPDVKTSDPDMSLNYKNSSKLADMALRLVLAAPKDERPKKPAEKKPGAETIPKKQKKKDPQEPSKKPPTPEVGPKAPAKNTPSSNREGLQKAISNLDKILRDQSSLVADDFSKYSKEKWLAPLDQLNDETAESKSAEYWHEVEEFLQSADEQSRNMSSKISALDAERLPKFIASKWPHDETDWATRAAIISGVKHRIDKISLPASLKAPLMRSGKSNKELIRSIVDDVDDVDGNFSAKSAMNGDVATFAILAAVYRAISKNPPKLDENKLLDEVQNVQKTVHDQVSDLLTAMYFMQEWEKSVKNQKHSEKEQDPYKPKTDTFSKALKDLDGFFGSKKPLVDPKELIDGFRKKLISKYGKIPKSLEPTFGGSHTTSSGATSYDAVVRKVMVQKSATFHGVVQQGHPSGETNTGYNSYDKRYFGKEHYASILNAAKTFLSEDWLAYGWKSNNSDAKFRAALDLAIHTADSNLYQSKIDAETYEMLLNRLAGWGHDSFSETVYPVLSASKRSTSAMKTQYRNIVRIANDLRNTDPKRALAIMTSLRTLVAQEQEGMGSNVDPAAPLTPSTSAVSQSDQNHPQGMPSAAPAPATAQITESDTDAFVDGKLNMNDLKTKTKKLVDAKDMDDFIAGLKDLHEIMKKTAAGRVANDLPELSALEDMSDDEVAAFIKDQSAKAKDMLQALSGDDLDTFMKNFDEITKGAEETAKHVKTGSVRVNLSTLVRLAKSNSEVARVLMPVLVAAKKKMDKKKKKPAQTSQKEESESDKKDSKSSPKKENPFAKKDDKKKSDKGDKKVPFGGKKAPPFGKKDDKKTSQKRKAATIEPSDSEW